MLAMNVVGSEYGCLSGLLLDDSERAGLQQLDRGKSLVKTGDTPPRKGAQTLRETSEQSGFSLQLFFTSLSLSTVADRISSWHEAVFWDLRTMQHFVQKPTMCTCMNESLMRWRSLLY